LLQAGPQVLGHLLWFIPAIAIVVVVVDDEDARTLSYWLTFDHRSVPINADDRIMHRRALADPLDAFESF
jgi:hypothetical protein